MWNPHSGPFVGFKRKTRVSVGFRNAYVFDVEQTKCVELATVRQMTGRKGENHGRLVSFIGAQGIELGFTEKIAPALGMSYGGRIAILPDSQRCAEQAEMPDAELAKVA